MQKLRGTIEGWWAPTPLALAAHQSLAVTDEAEREARAIAEAADAQVARRGVTNATLATAAFIDLDWYKGKARKDPCKAGESDAKMSPFELKTQGKDIAEGDKLRKYTSPCDPPPFLSQSELQRPGLPTIPIAPPIEMPAPYDPGESQTDNPGWSQGSQGGGGGTNNFGGADAMAYAAAMSALRRL